MLKEECWLNFFAVFDFLGHSRFRILIKLDCFGLKKKWHLRKSCLQSRQQSSRWKTESNTRKSLCKFYFRNFWPSSCRLYWLDNTNVKSFRKNLENFCYLNLLLLLFSVSFWNRCSKSTRRVSRVDRGGGGFQDRMYQVRPQRTERSQEPRRVFNASWELLVVSGLRTTRFWLADEV